MEPAARTDPGPAGGPARRRDRGAGRAAVARRAQSRVLAGHPAAVQLRFHHRRPAQPRAAPRQRGAGRPGRPGGRHHPAAWRGPADRRRHAARAAGPQGGEHLHRAHRAGRQRPGGARAAGLGPARLDRRDRRRPALAGRRRVLRAHRRAGPATARLPAGAPESFGTALRRQRRGGHPPARPGRALPGAQFRRRRPADGGTGAGHDGHGAAGAGGDDHAAADRRHRGRCPPPETAKPDVSARPRP